MDEVQNVTGIAAQPVEQRHNQFVARPQELKDGSEFCASLSTAARDLFRLNDLAPLRLKLGELGKRLLYASMQPLRSGWPVPGANLTSKALELLFAETQHIRTDQEGSSRIEYNNSLGG
jgi:hypothetical protein